MYSIAKISIALYAVTQLDIVTGSDDRLFSLNPVIKDRFEEFGTTTPEVIQRLHDERLRRETAEAKHVALLKEDEMVSEKLYERAMQTMEGDTDADFLYHFKAAIAERRKGGDRDVNGVLYHLEAEVDRSIAKRRAERQAVDGGESSDTDQDSLESARSRDVSVPRARQPRAARTLSPRRSSLELSS